MSTDGEPPRQTVALRRGNVYIRPIRPDDKEALLAAFEHLGPESRYRRFLSLKNELSRRDLSYLTEVDHRDHEALIAFDAASGAGVGIARFIRSKVDPRSAEVAVAVVDEWQDRGLGTELLHRLVERARVEGVRRVTGLVLADNHDMLDLFDRLGAAKSLPAGGGTVEISVELPPGRGIGEVLATLLRDIGRGDFEAFEHLVLRQLGLSPPVDEESAHHESAGEPDIGHGQ